MSRKKTGFIPIRIAVNFAGFQKEIQIFGNMISWLRHLEKHFGDPAEPWASCLGESQTEGVKDLRDRINKAGKESYLIKLHDLCQKMDAEAVEIYRTGSHSYRSLAHKIGKIIAGGFHYPRYIVMAMQRKGEKKKGQRELFAYVISEPLAAFGVIRSYVLKTIYFPVPRKEISSDAGIRIEDAKVHMFLRTGNFVIDGEPISYTDGRTHVTFMCQSEDMKVFIPETCWPRYVFKSYAKNE